MKVIDDWDAKPVHCGPYRGSFPDSLLKHCLQCHGLIKKRDTDSWDKYFKLQFCSVVCYGLFKSGPQSHFFKPRETRKCVVCTREIVYARKAPPSTRRRKFCSLNCRRKHFNRSQKPWNGYTIADYGGRSSSGKVKARFVHVLIAEKVMGRKLRRNEVVHHINGNRSDNRNCNLLICSVGYHTWLHQRMSRLYMEEHFA